VKYGNDSPLTGRRVASYGHIIPILSQSVFVLSP